jgi:hypothetical protein
MLSNAQNWPLYFEESDISMKYIRPSVSIELFLFSVVGHLCEWISGYTILLYVVFCSLSVN